MQPTIQVTPALAATVAICAPRSMPPRLHQSYVDAIHCVFTNNRRCIVRRVDRLIRHNRRRRVIPAVFQARQIPVRNRLLAYLHLVFLHHPHCVDGLRGGPSLVGVLRLVLEMGALKLGRVALDGSKVKANASKHKAMSYGRMDQE